MSNQRFPNVWDAIEDTPEEAENMKLRSVLMTALKNHITRSEMSQAQAAKLFGVTQPRISDLMRGKINLFGLDARVNMVTAAGLHIEMRVLKRPDSLETRRSAADSSQFSFLRGKNVPTVFWYGWCQRVCWSGTHQARLLHAARLCRRQDAGSP
jgi:predicted XRE-type DNA-binding protein